MAFIFRYSSASSVTTVLGMIRAMLPEELVSSVLRRGELAHTIASARIGERNMSLSAGSFEEPPPTCPGGN